MDEFVEQMDRAYSFKKSHATFTQDAMGRGTVIIDYEPLKLHSFRAFFAITGTILQDARLLMEQVFLTFLFCMAAFPVWYFFNKQAVGVAKDVSTRKWFNTQEARMREFALIMMMIASLMLAISLGMSVARWWIIRTAGVGGIKAAEMELTMFISQMVTQEEKVLQSIRRYSRASLLMVFLWRRKQLGPAVPQEKTKETLRAMFCGPDAPNPGLLTEDEVNQLAKWNHCLHETIWAWQTAIVCLLHQEGKIKSDPLLRTLLEKCSDGRQAVQVVHTHLAVKIPMQYVHLLGLLVKMHNVVLAVIMGALFGAAVRNREVIICLQLFGRTLILPLLFNAILLINAELSDPFCGGQTDFPGSAYSAGLEKDGTAFIAASSNMPDWLAKRNPLPV